ncbi:hypothetical protein EDC04DRAFT_2717780 [Pisolithus marmoratus]|nr:hypothetical protein EDC04DRAFT_2717780 [Pisolithus marmoratus]
MLTPRMWTLEKSLWVTVSLSMTSMSSGNLEELLEEKSLSISMIMEWEWAKADPAASLRRERDHIFHKANPPKRENVGGEPCTKQQYFAVLRSCSQI